MKELQSILKKIEQISSDEPSVLATVVDVQGSSYRLPGARMLIDKNGSAIGTVSGGCLEADVLERARRVLQTGAAEVFTYDTTTALEDSVFSLNMGCRGVIRILLEPVGRKNALFKVWKIASEERKRQSVATLISSENNTPVGGRVFYGETKEFDFESLPKFLESSPQLLEDCVNFFEENAASQTKNLQFQQGNYEFFFENINPPVNLIIFGAGADAIPLAETAEILGWRVTIVDHRAVFASEERFPAAAEIIAARSENLDGKLTIDENTVAVVMTHNYEHDKNILRLLLNSNARYVGSLGPKRRAENILREWRESDDDFAAEQLDKLYAPIGLDIGADTPEGIALSITAEIQSVLANRTGGFLRERRGSIYKR